MSYLNFNVEVISQPDSTYRVSTTSPVGEASAVVRSPFTTEQIARYTQIFSRERPTPRSEETAAAKALGDALFNFLLRASPEISNAYFTTLDRVRGGSGVRIRLTVDGAGDLASLPWEFLRDPSRDFLALSRMTPVIRYTSQLNIRPPARIALPLRVLVMISAPQDHPALDVEGEWQLLQEATAPLRAKGMIELERLDHATLIALQRRLRAGVYHVFHYIGHSEYDPDLEQGVILFEREGDPTRGQKITGTSLSRELAEESTIRLVVMNSCQSGHPPDADALNGIASAIVARGIPAVVAMQYPISDGAAKAFAEEFYRALSELLPLDAAMSEARRAVANRLHNAEWATPILFSRESDGVLFETQELSRTDEPIDAPDPTPLDSPRPRGIAIGVGALLLIGLLVLITIGLVESVRPPVTPTPSTALLPDLTVGNLRISPRRPAPGQVFILSITLTNIGEAPSGAFNWSWDASLRDPVLQNSLVGRIDDIPPGASRNISFPFSYGWWGTYSSQLVVDVDSEVREADERNNRRPFDVAIPIEEPFFADFSLVPPNVIATPPLTLAADAFDFWNLSFDGVGGCAGTPLLLTAIEDDIALSFDPAAGDCARSALRTTITRATVAGIDIEVRSRPGSSVTARFFSDPGGAGSVSEVVQTVPASGVVTLSGFSNTTGLRRVDVDTDAPDPVILTSLRLSPTTSTVPLSTSPTRRYRGFRG